MLSKGDLVLAKHYKDLLDIIKVELDKRLLTTSDSLYNFNYQNQIVKAEELNFLIDKVDLLKKYDETAGLNFENQDQFIENLNAGRLNSISYNIGKVDNTNLILAEKLNQISNVLPKHINLCVCNCNYCACNCNYWSVNRYPSLPIENTDKGLGTRKLPNEYPYEFFITSAIDITSETPVSSSKIYFMENIIEDTLQDKIFQLKFKEQKKSGRPTKAEKITQYPGNWYLLQITNGETVYDSKGNPLFKATWGKIKLRIDLYNVTDFHLYWDSKITLK